MSVSISKDLKYVKSLKSIEVTTLEFPLESVQELDGFFMFLGCLELIKDTLYDVEEVSTDLELDVVSAALNVKHIMTQIVASISNAADEPVSHIGDRLRGKLGAEDLREQEQSGHPSATIQEDSLNFRRDFFTRYRGLKDSKN